MNTTGEIKEIVCVHAAPLREEELGEKLYPSWENENVANVAASNHICESQALNPVSWDGIRGYIHVDSPCKVECMHVTRVKEQETNISPSFSGFCS